MSKKDMNALMKRLEFFSKTPSLQWRMLDKKIRYNFREDRLAVAKKLGFDYISECTVKLYYKHMSTDKVGKIVGCSGEGIMSELKKLGVKRQKSGGWRPGEKRAGRKSRNLLQNRIRKGPIRKDYNGPFTG